MRTGQNKPWRGRHPSGQNKQLEGRRNSGHNPHTKFYESNGPDVKVRGTASSVAEKYQQLARDAHTSGDLVAAEAYQQYAEHYYRLVAAEQERSRAWAKRPSVLHVDGGTAVTVRKEKTGTRRSLTALNV